MEKDFINFVRRCHKCQVYSDKINAPPAPLFNMVSPWPFAMWGIDVIGPINPKASNGHRFILVAIDYFTKWVKACSYAHVTQKVVKRFIEKDLPRAHMPMREHLRALPPFKCTLEPLIIIFRAFSSPHFHFERL